MEFKKSIWDRLLEEMSNNPEISEIESNGPESLFIKKGSDRVRVKYVWPSEDAYWDSVIKELGPHLVVPIDDLRERNSLFEAPLETNVNGVFIKARTHIMLPPVSKTPQITIARKSFSLNTVESLALRGSMSKEMMDFLHALMAAKCNIVFSGKTGSGKALSLDTVIPTPNGYKKMRDIEVGDLIFDYLGNTGKVQHKFPQDPRQVYEVKFNTGDKFFADIEHNWYVNPMLENGHLDESIFLTTGQLIKFGLKHEDGSPKYYVPSLQKEVEFIKDQEHNIGLEPSELPVHPYTFGYELAASSSLNENVGVQMQIEVIEDTIEKKSSETVIPKAYINASTESRRLLLSGLFEASVDKENLPIEWVFESTQNQIVESVHAIASSLGLLCFIERKGVFSRVKMSTKDLVSTVSLKFVNVPESSTFKTTPYRYIESIDIVDGKLEEMACISVNTPNNVYLIGNGFVTTHNTTMLEAMAKLMPHSDRIGVAEDTPELMFDQPNTSYLASVPYRPGMNPNDVATLSWVVSQFQRMRIDRVVIGETRGKEFADFLTAANAGMDGSITTMHGENPKDAIRKMAEFVSEAKPGLPISTINRSIANAIDVVVQLGEVKYQGKKYRKVLQIEEISKTISKETSEIATTTLYSWNNDEGVFEKNANMHNIRDKMESAGVNIEPFLGPPKKMPPHGGSSAPARSNFGNLPNFGTNDRTIQ